MIEHRCSGASGGAAREGICSEIERVSAEHRAAHDVHKRREQRYSGDLKRQDASADSSSEVKQEAPLVELGQT